MLGLYEVRVGDDSREGIGEFVAEGARLDWSLFVVGMVEADASRKDLGAIEGSIDAAVSWVALGAAAGEVSSMVVARSLALFALGRGMGEGERMGKKEEREREEREVEE